jgi:hypothetical protein
MILMEAAYPISFSSLVMHTVLHQQKIPETDLVSLGIYLLSKFLPGLWQVF